MLQWWWCQEASGSVAACGCNVTGEESSLHPWPCPPQHDQVCSSPPNGLSFHSVRPWCVWVRPPMKSVLTTNIYLREKYPWFWVLVFAFAVLPFISVLYFCYHCIVYHFTVGSVKFMVILKNKYMFLLLCKNPSPQTLVVVEEFCERTWFLGYTVFIL